MNARLSQEEEVKHLRKVLELSMLKVAALEVLLDAPKINSMVAIRKKADSKPSK